MASKPKAPKPTAQELELQRRQRDELDELTRNLNARLKAIKRTLGGRRSLLGSGRETGVDGSGRGGSGSGGSSGRSGSAGGPGGILSGGGGARGAGGVSGYRRPSRASAL